MIPIRRRETDSLVKPFFGLLPMVKLTSACQPLPIVIVEFPRPLYKEYVFIGNGTLHKQMKRETRQLCGICYKQVLLVMQQMFLKDTTKHSVSFCLTALYVKCFASCKNTQHD